MTTLATSIHFLAVSLAILVTHAPPASPALADNPAQVPANGQSWRVEYIDGPITETRGRKHQVVPLHEGATLKMKAEGDEIVFESKKGPVLSIPSSCVTKIAYDHYTHRVSRAVVEGISGLGSCGYGCGAIVMADLLVAAVALPFKYTNHYVRISWQDQKEEKTIEFKVDKKDYQPLLSQLQIFTGVNWNDMPQEIKGAQQAFRGPDPCGDPALAGNDLAIPLGKFKKLEYELNSAGACGFRLLGFDRTQSAGLTMHLHKESPDGAPYQYLLVRQNKPSKTQKALNEAGAKGYHLLPEVMWSNMYVTFLVMEKPRASANENYEYLYFTAWRESKLKGKEEAATQQGYQVLIRRPGSSGHVLILERSAHATS